jgi:hypothetical protein
MSDLVPVLRLIPAIAYLMSAGQTFAEGQVLCELSPLQLPTKVVNLSVGANDIPVQVDGRMEFNCASLPSCTTTETVTARVKNTRIALREVLLSNVGQLPQEQCGARISLGDLSLSAPGGVAQISLPLSVEEWGCLVGVAGKLAYGVLTFDIAVTPRSTAGKIQIDHVVRSTGGLTSTVPNVDDRTSQQVAQNVSEATNEIVDAVKQKFEQIFFNIAEAENNETDPTSGLPFYHPVDRSIAFTIVQGDLALVRVRVASMRQGTTCTIRGLAVSEWDKITM